MSLLNFLEPVAQVIKTVVERQVVDKNTAQKITNEIEKELALAAVQSNQGQIEVNAVQARSVNWFVSGGRPAFMWVGCLILLNQYIIAPYLNAYDLVAVMTLDDHLWEVIFGLLGLSGVRTFEKIKGVARS